MAGGTKPPYCLDVVKSVVLSIPHSHGDDVVGNCGGFEFAESLT